MNLDTIVIDPDEALERLAEYKDSLLTDRNREDAAIAAGYRAAVRGLPIISLQRTVGRGGFHKDNLPRLAVARADDTEVFVRWDGSALVYSAIDDRWVNRGALVNDLSVRVPVSGDDLPQDHYLYRRAGRTMVPLIPPRHRPHPNRMHRHHILWEVDQWTWVPPEDPALIKHLRGDMWVVLATWDLTELERLVLAQR